MVKNVDYVECEICGKRVQILAPHLQAHKIRIKEYRALYPEAITISSLEQKRRSEKLLKLNQNEEFRRASNEGCARSELKKELARANLKKINSDFKSEWREKQKEGVRKANKTPERRELQAKNGRKRFADNPELWASKLNYGGISHRPEFEFEGGKIRCVRSKLEWNILTYLKEQNIVFEYEKRRIPYISFDKLEHSYIPDIFIEPNIILEVKPKNLQEDELSKLKRVACEEQGYKFFFISDKFDVDELLNTIKVQRLSKV